MHDDIVMLGEDETAPFQWRDAASVFEQFVLRNAAEDARTQRSKRDILIQSSCFYYSSERRHVTVF